MRREFPDRRTLLIVTGGPGTGKSGTARRFLEYLRNEDISVISYDALKEEFWDRFGFDSPAEKDRVSDLALEAFYLTVRHDMWAGRTILIEYPFYQRHRPELLRLVERFHYHAATIYLYTDFPTMYERGRNRDGEAGRHPGHLLNAYHKETFSLEYLSHCRKKEASMEELRESLSQKDYDIAIGLRLPVDVTDFHQIDYAELYQAIVEYEGGDTEADEQNG